MTWYISSHVYRLFITERDHKKQKKIGKKLNSIVAKLKHYNDKGVFGHKNFFLANAVQNLFHKKLALSYFKFHALEQSSGYWFQEK